MASAPIRSPRSSGNLNPATEPVSAQSRLTVLAGPTAVGKGVVADEIRARYRNVWISVSMTTRKPRPGETHGVHYWFLDEDEFDEQIASGELLEWAVVHGRARYGTPREPVRDALAQGGSRFSRLICKVPGRCDRPCPRRFSCS